MNEVASLSCRGDIRTPHHHHLSPYSSAASSARTASGTRRRSVGPSEPPSDANAGGKRESEMGEKEGEEEGGRSVGPSELPSDANAGGKRERERESEMGEKEGEEEGKERESEWRRAMSES